MADNGSIFVEALEAIPHVKSPSGEMLTKPFLDVCRLVLPVIDRFGTAMSMVKSDIGGNVRRLDAIYDSDSTKYYLLYDIVQKEVAEKSAKNSQSCTNALLWLTRAMEFLVELFRNLVEHPNWAMQQVCSEAYAVTLKKWHGWIASAAFTVAMKLTPERKKFIEALGSGDLDGDIKKFVTFFPPLLEENHKFLQSVGLDNLKAS